MGVCMNYNAVRRPAVVMLLASIMALLLFPAITLRAQEEGTGNETELGPVTRTFAIRNARIVQGPGRVIERGTVVVRDGLIAAVGADVAIPFDARIIEGDSLVVYAGFIDGLTTAGVPKPKEKKHPKVPRPGDPPDDVAGIMPERDVRTLLATDDPMLDSLRMAGFTVAHVVPWGPMLPGSGAVVSLAGRTPGEMILRGDASLFARLEPAGDVYPATDMAIMAKWRQLYREASRRKAAGRIYTEDPAGIERPRYDPVLDAFFPVIDGRKPVFFQAEGALDLRRVLQLRQELGFPLVIAGLREGYDVADVLKSGSIPLFLSLDLPKKAPSDSAAADAARSDSTQAAMADTVNVIDREPPDSFFLSDRRAASYKDVKDEEIWLKRRQEGMRHTFEATPAMLHRQGLRFGFCTYGTSPGDIRENLRMIIAAGLPEDAALAALTVDAARVLGLENSHGTIDRGKVANLVLTNGNYFDRRTSVRYLFIDGRLFEYEQKKAGGASDSLIASVPGDTLEENPALAARHDASVRGSMLIRNATVLTVTNGTLEESDILVRDGRIAQIGKGLATPVGGETIDATGMYVMPGIIDAHSHIAISDINEWTNPVTAEVSVGDVIDPYDISIYRALAGGVTACHVMHGSANVIGGRCETIKLRYGTADPHGLVMEGAPRTIKFALGENPTRVHGRRNNVEPSTRMGVEDVIRRSFTEARRYMAAHERYDAERKKNSRATAPGYDLRLETLAAVLRGDIIVHCHSYRADEILMLMRVFRDFGIRRIVFQHVNEGFKVAPELAEFGAMASVFSDWWAYKFEVYYSTAYNAAILTRNGVITSINSDSPELMRHLNHEAAKTMKYGGLTRDEALALITINPARQLGIEERVGSIEVGKEADLAIFSAYPLSIYAVCQKTIVDGVIRFDRDKDPDDMRLHIDPQLPVETATISTDDGDRCMQGTGHLFRLQEAR